MIRRLLDVVGQPDRDSAVRGLSRRYAIERELGQGGMAVVYLARDRQLDREVAIKVLRSTLSQDQNSVARLTHEARMVAQLQHPHIVSIYDLERLRDRTVALVMQYVRGRTLRSIIDEQGPLPVAFVERVLSEIADALAVAHRSGIIHRDVKPENIYLEQESGRALLADFGIARAPQLEAGLTLTGEALGTPNYMSPEQISGGEMDGRSDLYSLGLVGYEMLTGERPWGGEALYHVLHKQQHEDLPCLRDRRDDLSASLQGALGKVLRKEPEHRPDTAESFLSLLTNGGPAGVEPEDERATTAKAESRKGAPDAPTMLYRRSDLAGGESAAGATAPVKVPAERVNTSAPPGFAPVSPVRAAPVEADPPRKGAGASAAASSGRPGPSAPPPSPSPRKVDAHQEDLALLNTFRQKVGVAPIQGSATLRRPPTPAAGEEKPRSISTRALKGIGIAGVSLATAALVVLFGVATAPRDSDLRAAAPTTPQDSAPDDVASSSASRSATARPAPVNSGSGSSGGGARAAAREWRYQAVGDLTDVFCRPHDEERLDQWRSRVPDYCHSRARVGRQASPR